ncbi:MAG TPA: DUF6655 family protein [Alphaproteobacteria bacterium]|nr:DUF6655 family protein [Alphaproteobacteria bacterium]
MEQLLISAAADRAVDQLKLDLPPRTKVLVDSQYFEGLDAKYTIGAIRDRLLKQGADLVADRNSADVVIEIRSGGQSIDKRTTLWGIPGFNIPIPLSSGSLPFPELALYKKEQEIGVSKVAMTGYDRKGGEFKTASGPDYGFSRRTHYIILLFFSWTNNDAVPGTEDNK